MMYKILVSRTPEMIASQVSDHIKKNWEPLGGLQVATNIAGPGTVRYFQAMIRVDVLAGTAFSLPAQAPEEKTASLEAVDATDGARELAEEHGIDLAEYYEGERLTAWDVKDILAREEKDAS